uniref:Putative glycerol kinase 5 n=1 Tax=Schistocephalus solidus TaxID=70667 RepID=A0A0V0J5B8_SCHSO
MYLFFFQWTKKLASAVRCLGLSVQRNSFLLWDRATSEPVTEMSCWYDTSASAFAAALNQSRFVESINKSGRILYKALPTTKFKIISNYSLTGIFACTRLAHLFAENPELERRCLKGEFIFGCLETWLLWRLTGGRAWCTDVSCTSASGMFDPCTLKWSHLILNFLKVSQRILPSICPTSCNFGIVRCGPLARDAKARQLGVPPVYVTALIGDSQAAMLGEGCLDKGDTKLTLGTGSFLNCNLGSKTIPPPKGFYPVVGWALSVRDRDSNITCETSPDTKLSNVTYLLEGFNSEGGRTLSRLQRLGLFQNFDDLDDLLSAASTRHRKSSNTTVYVPSSLGLKNYRKSKKSERPEVEALEARLLFVNTNSLLTQGGVFVGLPASLLSAPRPASSLSAEESGAILLAVFNALTMASRLMVSKCRGRDFANKLPVLRVNGNLSRSAWLMQRLADTLDVPVERSPLSETCCLGAAVAAGVGAGFWQDYSEALPALHTQKALKEADLSASGIPFKTRFEPNPAIVYPQEQAYCRWLRTCNKILLSQASFTSAEPSDCTNADLSSVPGVAFDVLAKHLA